MSLATPDPNAAHKVVVWVHVEVHEELSDGSCAGRPLRKEKFTLAASANNRELALERLTEITRSIKNTCPVQ